MAEKSAETLTKDEKLAQAKELYSRGSRNYLVKAYEEAADDLSHVCSLYADIYGDLSNELGMPYLLYAKSLIALALDENKVLDVPDQEDDEEDDGDGDADADEEENDDKSEECEDSKDVKDKEQQKESNGENGEKLDNKDDECKEKQTTNEIKVPQIQPGTSDEDKKENGADNDEGDEANDAATNLQIAWEILELAAKIFENQGDSALPNLAEVFTELGNIEFENNLMEEARTDYNKALAIYGELLANYRRPMAEINYKIGLSFLESEPRNSAKFLKEACQLLDEEMNEMKTKENPSEKELLNLQDIEETKQEIWAKITEIEESLQQCISEVKAAIQQHMNPQVKNTEYGEPSSSSSAAAAACSTAPGPSSAIDKSKPTDISHLIKRKKPESSPSADNDIPPAKRPVT